MLSIEKFDNRIWLESSRFSLDLFKVRKNASILNFQISVPERILDMVMWTLNGKVALRSDMGMGRGIHH